MNPESDDVSRKKKKNQNNQYFKGISCLIVL